MTEAPPKIKARFPILNRFAEALGPHPLDNPWLDLLRTFAILLVLARHAPRQINAGPAVSWWEKATLNGWMGLCCTNRLMTEVTLSPDGLIPRLQ